MNNSRAFVVFAIACLPLALSACTSPGRSDPVNTPYTPEGNSDSPVLGKADEAVGRKIEALLGNPNTRLVDALAAWAPPARKSSSEEQRRAGEVATAWFQASMKDQFTVIDHRVVLTDLFHQASLDYNTKMLAGFMGGTKDTVLILPSPFDEFQLPEDLRSQGWNGPSSKKYQVYYHAWQVEKPHPGVVAMAYLAGILPHRGHIIAYFELKSTPERG